MSGCSVYLISAGEQMTKIGMSRDPVKRLAALRTGNGDKMALDHVWPLTSDEEARTLEKSLHKILAWARVRREWFSLEARMIQGVGDALIAGESERAATLSDIIQQWCQEMSFIARCDAITAKPPRAIPRARREEAYEDAEEAIYCASILDAEMIELGVPLSPFHIWEQSQLERTNHHD